MAATMTTMPRSGDVTTPLSNKATPLNARSTTTRLCSGDNANLGDNATPLVAHLVAMTPSLETLGDGAKLGDNSTLCDNDATFDNKAMGYHAVEVIR